MKYEMKSIQATQMTNNWTYRIFGSVILILEKNESLFSLFSHGALPHCGFIPLLLSTAFSVQLFVYL